VLMTYRPLPCRLVTPGVTKPNQPNACSTRKSKPKPTHPHTQADVALRSVPVVVLSVDDRTADIVGCMELGAKDYFIKPIRMDQAPSLLKFARDRCVPAWGWVGGLVGRLVVGGWLVGWLIGCWEGTGR
jgi:hypothetical protein